MVSLVELCELLALCLERDVAFVLALECAAAVLEGVALLPDLRALVKQDQPFKRVRCVLR